MDTEVTGAATTDSPPVTQDVSPAESSTATDVQVSDSSTEGGLEAFSKRVAELEGTATAKTEESPTPEETTEPEAKVSDAAPKDDPAAEATKAPDPAALSQSQDEVSKAFDTRPEWKKALSLVPKDKQAEMRETMRGILGREVEVAKQVEARFQPVVKTVERLKAAVGDESAVENTIALTELFQRGDPKAREMLMTLINDLDARTGNILTSPDLVQREAQIQKQLDDGLLDPEMFHQAKNDLRELQKARVGQRQTETQTQQAKHAEQVKQFQTAQTELTTACDAWESDRMKSEPDYPSLKSFVETKALVLANEKQSGLGRILNGTEIKSVLDDALKQVKAEAAKLRPPPKARQAITGNGSSATSRRAPANKAEAFAQAVEKYEQRL